MKVAAVTSDLMLFSRIAAAAEAGDADLSRADHPAELTASADLVLVDWSARDPSWVEPLRRMRLAGSRLILYGPHADLEAHAAARSAGLGPMWGRSRFFTYLPDLVAA